jgi:membrane associated rhomboid family serine protease
MNTLSQTSRKNKMQPAITFAVLVTAVLWVIHSAAQLFGFDQGQFGIRPMQLDGLLGIITGSLVHGSYEHLFNNTLSLLILLSMLWYGYPNSRIKVLSLIWVVSGIGVWLFARQATHLGASGLTHGLFFFLFTVSIFRRDKRSVVLMMIAFFMYGGMVMTIFPREPGISYEYHFFGGIAGVIAAFIWHKADPKLVEPKYEWEKDGYQQENDLTDRIGDEWRLDFEAENRGDESNSQTFNFDSDMPESRFDPRTKD